MRDYFHSQGRQYAAESDRHGYISIEVLHFLKGKPWDDVALAYVSAVKPSRIRVLRHGNGETLDAITDRVSIYLDEAGLISKIRQEVRVWLPERVAHGEALRHALQYGGIDSPQCQWHNDDRIDGYFVDGVNGGYFKMLKDGDPVPFPKDSPS